MNAKKKITVLLMAAVFLSGLVAMGCVKDITDLSPKGKASAAMKIYAGSAMDYQNDMKRLNLTDEHKKYLREKKKILDEAYPSIDIYRKYAETGVIPTLEMEQELLRVLDQLLLFPALGY